MRARQRREVDVGLVLGALAQAEGEALERHPGSRARPARPRRPGRSSASRSARSRRACRVSAGTSRQPRTVRPSSSAICSIRGGSWPPRRRRREERGADGVAPAARELEVDDLAQEGVGDLHQDAGTVAGVGLGAGGTSVVEVAQRGQRLGHDVVAGHTGQGRDKGHAARVVLVARVVEPCGARKSANACMRGTVLPSSSPHAQPIAGTGVRGGGRYGWGRRWPAREGIYHRQVAGTCVRRWDSVRSRSLRAFRRRRPRAPGCGPTSSRPGCARAAQTKQRRRARTARSRSTR